MARIALIFSAGAWLAIASGAATAEPVMVQCGRAYQAARTAGTLNGMDWNGYRTECAARLKASATQPVTATPASPPAQPSAALPTPVAPIAVPASPSSDAAAAATGGMAAMHARQRQCGAEWRAQKAALVAQTPGLTWPRYWSQCNTRLKATVR